MEEKKTRKQVLEEDMAVRQAAVNDYFKRNPGTGNVFADAARLVATAHDRRAIRDASDELNQIAQNEVTMRGQDLTHKTAMYGHDTTKYGYDKQADTSRYGYDKQAESSKYTTDKQYDASIYGHDVSNNWYQGQLDLARDDQSQAQNESKFMQQMYTNRQEGEDIANALTLYNQGASLEGTHYEKYIPKKNYGTGDSVATPAPPDIPVISTETKNAGYEPKWDFEIPNLTSARSRFRGKVASPALRDLQRDAINEYRKKRKQQ